jgi:hypothetical protein
MPSLESYKKVTTPLIAWPMMISHNLVADFYRTKKTRPIPEPNSWPAVRHRVEPHRIVVWLPTEWAR